MKSHCVCSCSYSMCVLAVHVCVCMCVYWRYLVSSGESRSISTVCCSQPTQQCIDNLLGQKYTHRPTETCFSYLPLLSTVWVCADCNRVVRYCLYLKSKHTKDIIHTHTGTLLQKDISNSLSRDNSQQCSFSWSSLVVIQDRGKIQQGATTTHCLKKQKVA